MRKMQGFTAHLFAAAMTFTVLTFPTPGDLLKALQGTPSEGAQEIKRFPTLEASDPPLDALVSVEEYLPVVSACFLPDSMSEAHGSESCAAAIAVVRGPHEDSVIDRITTDEEALQIAQTFFCRSLWAEALRNRTDFNAVECLRS